LFLTFLFLSGFLSVLTQNILIREIYMVFFGNELTYGLVVSAWLFGVGLGAFLGRKINEDRFYLSFLALAIILPISIFLIRFLPSILGYNPGEIVGLPLLFFETFILLLPVYLTFGIIFALGLKKFSYQSERGIMGITRPYIVDSIGDLLGGIAFSYLFVTFFSPIRNLFLISTFSLIPVVILKGKRFIPLVVFFLLLFFLPIPGRLMKIGYTKLYKGFNIQESRETRYGRYMEIERSEKYSLLFNGVLTATFPEKAVSEKIHIPFLLSLEKEVNILYLGFPDPGVIKELLCYQSCTVVNPDPFAKQFLKENLDKKLFKKVNFVRSDPRMFARRSDKKFDAIFLEVGDPLSLSSNRFYSLEFARILSRILSKEGFLSFSIYSGEDYLNKTVLDYNSLLYWTFKEEFKNYLIIPGYHLRFVFSHEPFKFDERRIKEELDSLNLQYLDIYTIKSYLPEYRIQKIKEQINTNFVGFNLDTTPKAFLLALSIWLEKHSNLSGFLKTTTKLPGYILLVFLLLPLIFRKTGFKVGLIGAMGMGVGCECILSLQIIYGNVYHLVGLITGLFMFGVGCGTFLIEKLTPQRKLKLPFLFLGGLFFILFLVIQIRSPSLWTLILIPSLNFIGGIVVGWTYPIASLIIKGEREVENAAPAVYAYDLVGGGIGALLFSLFFIPVFGIIPTTLLFFGLSMIGYLSQ